jgi:choline dehydrogenase-like flavoprotein
MEYDDIIVGAGSAGAVLAARLSEDPQRSVLLLEAGPDYRTIDETPHNLLRTTTALADHNWGWVAQATAQREIPFHRGKVTGGCSAINSSVAIRGVPADFDQWAASGNSGWSFENVLPFYRKLEHDADFAATFMAKAVPSGSSAPGSRIGLQWSAPFGIPVGQWAFPTRPISTTRNRPVSARWRAICATESASRLHSVTLRRLAAV